MSALNPFVEAEYLKNIQLCISDFTFIPMFCDWLDENKIKSQQWREIAKFVPCVKYLYIGKGSEIKVVHMFTKHKSISITCSIKGKRITISIENRKNIFTNKYLEEMGYMKP